MLKNKLRKVGYSVLLISALFIPINSWSGSSIKTLNRFKRLPYRIYFMTVGFLGILTVILFTITTSTPYALAEKEPKPGSELLKEKLGNVKRTDRSKFDRLIKQMPAKLRPLEGDAPLLFLNDSFGPVILSRDVIGSYAFRTKYDDSGIYVRIRDRAFSSSCPPNGTTIVRGIADLDAVDGFVSPDRVVGPFRDGTGQLNLADPSYRPGVRYYMQGCVIRGVVALDYSSSVFTGEETNTVEFDFFESQPDLFVKDIKVLHGASEMGRLWIVVNNSNPEADLDISGRTVNYEITALRSDVASSDETPPLTYRGTATLFSGGWAWITPGVTDTPGGPSDDFRLPDDGHIYGVTVTINGDRSVPERSYADNSLQRELRLRGKFVFVILDRIVVKDDCDNLSPGDWVLIMGVRSANRHEFRFIHPCNGTINVDSGTTKNLRLTFQVDEVRDDEDLFIRVGAQDCDMDGPITFLIPAPPLWGASIASWVTTCGGEEIWEASGNADFAGWALFQLTPEQWQSDEEFEATSVIVPGTIGDDCGRDAFKAVIKILQPDHPEAPSREPSTTCILD